MNDLVVVVCRMEAGKPTTHRACIMHDGFDTNELRSERFGERMWRFLQRFEVSPWRALRLFPGSLVFPAHVTEFSEQSLGSTDDWNAADARIRINDNDLHALANLTALPAELYCYTVTSGNSPVRTNRAEPEALHGAALNNARRPRAQSAGAPVGLSRS